MLDRHQRCCKSGVLAGLAGTVIDVCTELKVYIYVVDGSLCWHLACYQACLACLLVCFCDCFLMGGTSQP